MAKEAQSNSRKSGRSCFQSAWWVVVLLLLSSSFAGKAEQISFTNFVAQGDGLEKRGEVAGALKAYSAAEAQEASCADLCLLTKRYCDLMYDTSSDAVRKQLAKQALTCAQQAVQADPKSATAHLCVAVCYAKNFPFCNNETKVRWSRAMKSECETAIALDPKQDVGYYLLGRWYFGTANMGFFAKGVVKVIYGGLPQASNEDAIRNFKQAIALAPGRIIHHRELAKVYEATGETKLERTELATCARLKPVDRDDAEAQAEAAKRMKNLE
jgi:tetratricopeptide (TPR) repeat protein